MLVFAPNAQSILFSSPVDWTRLVVRQTGEVLLPGCAAFKQMRPRRKAFELTIVKELGKMTPWKPGGLKYEVGAKKAVASTDRQYNSSVKQKIALMSISVKLTVFRKCFA